MKTELSSRLPLVQEEDVLGIYQYCYYFVIWLRERTDLKTVQDMGE